METNKKKNRSIVVVRDNEMGKVVVTLKDETANEIAFRLLNGETCDTIQRDLGVTPAKISRVSRRIKPQLEI